jgi:hypothetical protein
MDELEKKVCVWVGASARVLHSQSCMSDMQQLLYGASGSRQKKARTGQIRNCMHRILNCKVLAAGNCVQGACAKPNSPQFTTTTIIETAQLHHHANLPQHLSHATRMVTKHNTLPTNQCTAENHLAVHNHMSQSTTPVQHAIEAELCNKSLAAGPIFPNLVITREDIGIPALRQSDSDSTRI